MKNNSAGGLANLEHAVMADLERAMNRPEVEVGDTIVSIQEEERQRRVVGERYKSDGMSCSERGRYTNWSTSRARSASL